MKHLLSAFFVAIFLSLTAPIPLSHAAKAVGCTFSLGEGKECTWTLSVRYDNGDVKPQSGGASGNLTHEQCHKKARAACAKTHK